MRKVTLAYDTSFHTSFREIWREQLSQLGVTKKEISERTNGIVEGRMHEYLTGALAIQTLHVLAAVARSLELELTLQIGALDSDNAVHVPITMKKDLKAFFRELGRRFADRRNDLNLTQRMLDEMTDSGLSRIGQSHIGHIEKGSEYNPRLITISRLATALDVVFEITIE